MRSVRAITLLALAVIAFPFGGILAQTPAVVPDRVEEDWQLVIATPDINQIGHQITTTMSPNQDDPTCFVAFDLNYREYPTFLAGGMQIQVWEDNAVLATSGQGNAQFSTTGETVTWTQRMSFPGDGTIHYRVKNGQSTTWGQFGQGNGLLTVSFPTTLNSLIGYSADYSAAQSAASWQSNHVTSLTLVQVRYYAAGRLIATDTTSRPVSLGN